MRELHVIADPFHFINFLKIDVDKRPNEHPTAVVVGHISDEDDSCVERSQAGQKFLITAKDDSGADKIIFNGIVQEAYVTTQNDLRYLTVKGIANTIYMDIDKKTRTFQDKSMTYSQVTGVLEQDDGRFAIISPKFGSKQIERMFVQYEETNWQFAKRLASRLHTLVVPNYVLEIPYISLGMPRSSNKHVVSPTHYSIQKDTEEYLDFTHNGVGELSERDVIYYSFESREIFDLCDQVTMKGRQLYVYSISSRLEGAELYHTYTLKEDSGFTNKEFFNQKLIGSTLSGTVRQIKADLVRVNIFKDVRQTDYKWFLYSSLYTSPDGTGWYFMPEEGDEIRMKFPTEHEEDAYVVSSTHITHGKRQDPDTKFLRTVYNKEIIFKPHSIFISNGAGSSITLDDSNGITLDTTKQIRMNATDQITITGRDKIIIKGNRGVDVLQNDSSIQISDNIDVASGHTRLK